MIPPDQSPYDRMQRTTDLIMAVIAWVTFISIVAIQVYRCA